MIARGQPQFALRPYLPQDTPQLAEIFRASVEGLTEDDYTASQQDAWMAEVDDLENKLQQALEELKARRAELQKAAADKPNKK